MKALFVIYHDDPPEYFEQMVGIQTRVALEGGSWSMEKKVFSGWDKPPREYMEFVFVCENMSTIVG